MNKLSLSESVSSTLLFGLGIFSLWRGLFWVIEQESVISDSEFYQALHAVLPIWVWGILMIVSSLFLISASWLLPKGNRMFYWLLLVGGVATSLMYLIMTGASLFNSINWLSPMQFATLSSVCAVIAFFGGAELYARR